MHYRLVFLTLMFILISAFIANAQIPSDVDSLKIESGTSRPGEVVTKSIHLVNTFPVGGISSRLEFDQDVFNIQSVNLSDRTSFMSIFAVDTSETGVLMISAASFSPRTNYVEIGSGEVFEIEFAVAYTAEPGTYELDLRNTNDYSYDNHLSDTTGLLMYLPVLVDGELEIEPATFIDNHDNLPDRFYALSNYPNPFNNHTSISYSLVEGGEVELVIYDLLGREVKKFDYNYQPPGSYITGWDGRDNLNKEVSTGVYSYALYVNSNAILTSKMVLIK